MTAMSRPVSATAHANGAASRLEALGRRLRERARDLPPGDDLARAAEEIIAAADELRRLRAGDRGDWLEETLRFAQEQRLRYQELFDFAPDGYVLTDAQGVIREANRAAAALLETPREFLAGKPLPFFVAEGWRASLYDYLSGARRRGPSVESWETLLRLPKGQTRPCAVTVVAAAGDAGWTAGCLWTLRDISARKHSEQALREQKELADRLVETVEASVVFVDDRDRVVRANGFLHAATGHLIDDARGRDWVELLVAAEDRPAARAMSARARDEGTAKSGVVGLPLPGGGRRDVVWSARALVGGPGGVRLILLGFDVTELQQAQRRALQSERLAAIGEMSAGLAHEARNAMQRTQSCLSLLELRFEADGEARALIGRTQQALDDLHRLYEEVRGYAAPVLLENETCDLADVWRQAWRDLGPRADTANLWEESTGVRPLCLASPFHLRQVFRNLFENTLAHAPAPARLSVCCAPAALGGRPALRVTVRDDGPGFTPEARRRAFEPFFTTKAKGSGLGLPICKRIIEAHGGTLEIPDRPGPGGEVILTIPRSPS
jgi:PAS domain S-box-containing protein